MNSSECDSANITQHTDYVIGCLAIILGVLVVVFNVILVVIIKSSKILHTCTNAFVISIAMSEIFHGIFKMVTVASLRLSDSWIPEITCCHLLGFFLITGKTSAIWSLMMLAIDRCIAIYKPVQYSSMITPFSTGTAIIFVWLSSGLIGSIPFWGSISYEYDNYELICLFSRKSGKHHVMTVAILSMFLPTLIIFISICIIINEARSRHRIVALATLPIFLANIQPKTRLNTFRAVRSLFVIVFSYLIFCFPETVIFVLKLYHQSCLPKQLFDFKSIWTMMCCMVTPIAITVCNRNYSKRLRHLICKKCCRRKNTIKTSHFSVSTGLHSILEASYTISHFRPIPSNIILLASESSRQHLRNSVHANPAAQSRTLFEKPMFRKTLSSPDCY